MTDTGKQKQNRTAGKKNIACKRLVSRFHCNLCDLMCTLHNRDTIESEISSTALRTHQFSKLAASFRFAEGRSWSVGRGTTDADTTRTRNAGHPGQGQRQQAQQASKRPLGQKGRMFHGLGTFKSTCVGPHWSGTFGDFTTCLDVRLVCLLGKRQRGTLCVFVVFWRCGDFVNSLLEQSSLSDYTLNVSSLNEADVQRMQSAVAGYSIPACQLCPVLLSIFLRNSGITANTVRRDVFHKLTFCAY